MSSRPELRLDWCTHAAAKYAVERWHYSRSLPGGKLVKVGVWEGGKFVGVVVYGCGATPNIAKPYGLTQREVCELVRVALCEHQAPTSKVIALSLRMLRKVNPGLRLVVSYADTAQGHHGGIYQAGGWIYTGSQSYHVIRIHGRMRHPRSIGSRYGSGSQSIAWLRKHLDPDAELIRTPAKHKYLMPLDTMMQSVVMKLAQPYPKRAGSADSGTPDLQSGWGGASPTPALPS